MTRYLTLVVLLLSAGCAIRSLDPSRAPVTRPATRPVAKSLPKTAPRPMAQTKASPRREVILDHDHFRVSYDPHTRLANYVIYRLTAAQLRSHGGKRSNRFRVDPLLTERSLPAVDPKEYVGSGYDKGHLAPAADFAFDQAASDATFVMSNMAPQKPGLNQRAWKYLEDRVRRWACGEGEVTVITGPLFGGEKLGGLASGLPVPGRFFKTVVDETPPRKAVSFVYFQTDTKDVYRERVVPTPEVERASGLHLADLVDDPQVFEGRRPAALDDWKEADCRD